MRTSFSLSAVTASSSTALAAATFGLPHSVDFVSVGRMDQQVYCDVIK